MISSIVFIIFFLIFAPITASLLAEDIVQEEIFARPRAWIEEHCWPMVAYLVSCEKCLVHWTMALITLICYQEWSNIGFCGGWIIAFMCWAAGVSLSKKIWLRE